jgi:serine O-acetyltransferase
MSAPLELYGATGDPVRVPGLWEAIRGDLRHTAKIKEARLRSVVGLLDVLALPGTWSVLIFRLASTAHHRGLRPLSRLLFFLNVVVFGAELHPGAIVQPGLVVPHPVGMGFASGCRIGRRALLLRHSAMGGAGNPKRPGQPTLGDDVVLMDSARVLGPVTVGDRSIIGASALVTDDVPPDVFVYGVRKSEEFRPLADMGLGAKAEEALGYGISGRRTKATGTARQGESPTAQVADGSI